MNAIQQQRLVRWGLLLGCLGAAIGLVLWALSSHIDLFYTPKDLVARTLSQEIKQEIKQAKPPLAGQRFRLGGMVLKGSVVHGEALQVRFVVTDFEAELPVTYVGILPDLFREGQGVVATGTLVNGVFEAQEVLAKHDETYMPPEVKKALL